MDAVKTQQHTPAPIEPPLDLRMSLMMGSTLLARSTGSTLTRAWWTSQTSLSMGTSLMWRVGSGSLLPVWATRGRRKERKRFLWQHHPPHGWNLTMLYSLCYSFATYNKAVNTVPRSSLLRGAVTQFRYWVSDLDDQNAYRDTHLKEKRRFQEFKKEVFRI